MTKRYHIQTRKILDKEASIVRDEEYKVLADSFEEAIEKINKVMNDSDYFVLEASEHIMLGKHADLKPVKARIGALEAFLSKVKKEKE